MDGRRPFVARSMPRSTRAAVLAAALVIAGCAPSIGGGSQSPDASSSAAPSASAEPSVAMSAGPSASLEPSAGTSASAGASAAPSGAAAPTPAATDAGTMLVRAYFLLDDAGGGDPTLVPVLREVPQTRAVARASMRALLAGPNESERNATPAISTLIPAGTKLLGLAVDAKTATVDLSASFADDAGPSTMSGRVAEVVYTLTQFSRVERVRVLVEGDPLAGLDERWARRDLRDGWLPSIWVDRPAYGGGLEHGMDVRGLANVFEAQFRLTVLDADGDELLDQAVKATCGTGCWGRFASEVDYDVGRAQWGTLRVWDPSEADGSPESMRDYPIWLTPD